MEIRKLGLRRYKGYAEATTLELAPLTILVGSNNSGKSALGRAFRLLAEGLSRSEKDPPEPLPLTAGGIQYGEGFEDLVTDRAVHGWVEISLEMSVNGRIVSLETRIQNVVAPDQSSERQISQWRMTSGDARLRVEKVSLDADSRYRVSLPGTPGETSRSVDWHGLLPAKPGLFAPWVTRATKWFRDWAPGVRHLVCPRRLIRPPFPSNGVSPSGLGPSGSNTPLILASDDGLMESVRAWYRKAFGVSLEVRVQGPYSWLVVRGADRDADVALAQSGEGLSQALPVVMTAFTADAQGPGIDVIEHPEAELHPAVHVEVADLLLQCLPGPRRPVVVETHSEALLLRARRRIAEGQLRADQVLVYWVTHESPGGSLLRRIRIADDGTMEDWPEDVFAESYEEVLAIRRASRGNA